MRLAVTELVTYLLLTTSYFLLTTYYLLLTTYYLTGHPELAAWPHWCQGPSGMPLALLTAARLAGMQLADTRRSRAHRHV